MLDEGGAIERYSEADWVVGGVIQWEDIGSPDFTYYDNEYQYNQNEYQRNTCTVYASLGAYSDFTGDRVPLNERTELVDLAIQGGLDTNIGWYLHKAVALIADYYGDVSYARVTTNSEDFREAINRGYTLMYGYRGNREYNVDRDDDMIVQSNDWGVTTYGHAPRCCNARKVDNVIIVDNYDTRDSNVYTLPEFSEKVKNGEMFKYAYFYFDETELPMGNLPEHISPDSVSTPGRKQIVIARENEGSAWLNEGNELTYSVYTADTPVDETDVITRMLIDLELFRI